MPLRILVSLLAALMLFSSLEARRAKTPDWLKPLEAQVSKKTDNGEHEARVLLDWARYDFTRQGRPKLKVRYAVKILTWDEQERAKVSIPYTDRDDKIWRFKAWLIAPDGEVKEYDQKDTYDMAGDLDQLYSEERLRELDLSSTVRPGSIFAYEYEMREKTLITQRMFGIQQDVPVDHVRLIIDVPEGWELVFTPLNHPAGKASQSGNQYVWDAHDVEPFVDEDYGPHRTTYAGVVGFSLLPTREDHNRRDLISFRTWADVAAFGDRMNTPMCQVDSSIRAKAQELTAGRQSDWDKIRSIAAFAQSIQYAAIGEDLNFGGGYEPFPAPTVLERQYGDCKDMTALTRALLKAAGIESYSVSAKADSYAVVHEEYASPSQFNHCIVAIPVGDEVQEEAVVEHPVLGRLLIFDPTLEYAPIGNLPPYIAGSRILVDDPRVDALNILPENDMSKHFTHRDVTMNVRADGGVSAEITEINHGNEGIRERSLYYGRTPNDYEEMWRDYIASCTRDASIQSLEVEDKREEDLFIQKVQFDAPLYGRSMRGRLLVFKPVLIPLHEWTPPNTEERKTPFVKKASRYSENASITLPEGWIVDEMSEPVMIETPFGRYESEIHEEGGLLKLTRSIQWNAMDVAPEDYEQLVEFYEAVIKAENTPVVMVRG